jgi:hypothetical protein
MMWLLDFCCCYNSPLMIYVFEIFFSHLVKIYNFYLNVKDISASDRPRLGMLRGRLARGRLSDSPPAQGSGPQVHLLPLFLKLFPSLGLSPPLLFLSWRRRLGERRRHLSRLRPALCRRRAHPPGMSAPSLSFCCARRSTPNPNKTICVRI